MEIGSNRIKGSLTLQELQYQWMQVDGIFGGIVRNWEISENDSKLLVEDCLFEFCCGSLFRHQMVLNGRLLYSGTTIFGISITEQIGGRGRILDCKVPVDTLIFENNTTTGAGLTVLNQECLIEYGVINHNTFINNTKYPFLNQYWKEVYYTNNLFVNANWVGEDQENVATGGQDPDALLHGLVGLDTITTDIWCNGKFLNADSTALTDDVDEISDYIWYAADNVCVQSATLDAYYGGEPNDGIEGAPASYLTWGGLGDGPWKVVNVPGIFMNSRTEALVADHDNIKAENNSIYEYTAEELGFGTDPLPQAAANVYVQWNRSQWQVPDVETPDIQLTRFGDYDPLTIPGIETEDSDEGGITKISDMIEDFSYTMDLVSQSDGMPIGALHWDDIAFDSDASLAAIQRAYGSYGSVITFQVDLNQVSDLYDNGYVWLTFASPETRILMSDMNGDGIYSCAYEADPETILEYTFSYQNGPDTTVNYTVEDVPEECRNSNLMRALEVPFDNLILPAYEYESCSEAPVLVSHIAVSGAGAATSVVEGSTLQMEASITPSDAEDKTVSWSVNDPAIATIDENTGLLTGITGGVVTVTATANDRLGVSGTLDVTVDALVAGITVAGAGGATSLLMGAMLQMEAIITPLDAADKTVSWSVADPSIATINVSTGLLTGVSGGEVIVIATANDGSGVSGTLGVTVVSLVESIAVSGAGGATKVSAGSSLQMEASVLPADATDHTVSWSVDDPAIATIAETTGLLTGVSGGSVTVTATANDGSGIFGTMDVTVEALVTEITVSGAGGETSVLIGATLQMEATVLPSYAADKTVSWSVLDESIASIDVNSGLLTGIKAGEVTVLAVAKDGSGVAGGTDVTVLSSEPNSVFERESGELKFYPNPASDHIFLKDEAIADINIYTLLGKLVLSKQYVSSVNVEGLKPGSYIVEIKADDETVIGSLIIE